VLAWRVTAAETVATSVNQKMQTKTPTDTPCWRHPTCNHGSDAVDGPKGTKGAYNISRHDTHRLRSTDSELMEETHQQQRDEITV
jgi:hypothetical protein